MDAIQSAHHALERKSNMRKMIADANLIVSQLQAARDAIATSPELSAVQMVKLRQPVKKACQSLDDGLKDVNRGLKDYQKALQAKFDKATLPSAGVGFDGRQEKEMVEKAIGMHLLREGLFGVAGTFVGEVKKGRRTAAVDRASRHDAEDTKMRHETTEDWLHDFGDPEAMQEGETHGSGQLQGKFSELYLILDALSKRHDLGPAIDWSREHRSELEARGSNLEFELARLKFVELYCSEDIMSDDPFAGPINALQYARETFPFFSGRYAKETASLLGSLAFSSGLQDSPYKAIFDNNAAYSEAATSFAQTFTALLNLPPVSPLYTATTAGAIALPKLQKVERIMAMSRGQWTSVNELPVETPLPPTFLFHSIFVCPVSKEQATDANPPMMLPCGHVIAKESLEMHTRGRSRAKCPYCPNESSPREARRIYI